MSKHLRVLLIESDPEDAFFLTDVLQEIEDQRRLREWVRIETLHVATWAEAEKTLSAQSPDIDLALLNLNLSDSRGAETFRRSQFAARDVPIVLLVDPEDEILAIKLMREGAQDYVIKKQVDTGPLAHSIRNAVARHRVLSAARALAFTDPLTGLPNRAAFLSMAERDRKLAERLQTRWMLLIAQPRDLGAIESAYGGQRRDLELVGDADYLRSIGSATDLVARIGESTFALGIFDNEAESAEEAWVRVRAAAAERRIEIGACIFDPARPITVDAMLAMAESDLMPAQPSRAQIAISAAV